MKTYINNFAIVFSLAIPFIVVTPASASIIVNLDATSANTVDVYLKAGTYIFEPIGVSDGGKFNAWNPWASTTCADDNGCDQTYPTQYTGWIDKYKVSASSLEEVNYGTEQLSRVSSIPIHQESFFFYTDTLKYYRVYSAKIFPDDIASLANASSSSFTISKDEFVSFSILDSNYSDNEGGISLMLSSPEFPELGAPIPNVPGLSTLPLLLSSLPGLLIMAHRRNRAIH